MTTTLLRPEATATVDTTDVQIEGGASTLDSAAVPYASSTLVLPFLDDTLLDWLDPRDGVRVPYEAGDQAGTPRSFDLGLRSRTVDHAAKTVTLRLASDEALLMDRSTLTIDSGARAHEGSVRAVCDYVLDKIGAALEPGTDDADMTACWPITNELPNPSVEVDASNWIAGTGASALTRVAVSPVPGVTGSWGLRFVTGTGIANVVPVPTATSLRVTPGRWYVWTFYIYSSTPRTVSANVQWITQGGLSMSIVAGIALTTSTTAFQRASVIVQAPEGAAYANPYVATVGNASGDAHVLDSAMWYEGDEVVPYHDGDTPDSAAYTYDWQGAVGLSPSVRTPVVERSRELYTLLPGETWWDFLLAITSAAGLVLWCDEQRRWFLASPENRTIVELVSVQPGNTRDGSDTLSRDDDETFVTGVAIRYRWTDATGAQREAYDTAGTPEKMLLIDIARPFPGPGAAAAVLARRQGSGRRQTVTVVAVTGTTPGMTAQLSLPGAPDTVGRVQSVTFDHATGFMDLGMAGLVDIIPGTVDALTGTVDSLTGTVDSL